MWRTMFSSRSVATPELFLGQPTQSIPAGTSSLLMRLNSRASADSDFVKIIAKSSGVFPRPTILQPASSALKSALTSGGASTRHTRNPALIPSFFGSGVPEYHDRLWISKKPLTAKGTKFHEGTNASLFLREPFVSGACPERRRRVVDAPWLYCAVGAYHPRRARTRKFFRSLASISIVR